MPNYIYDNTFEGFLTCIFEIYRRNEYPSDICPCNEQKSLFRNNIEIETVPDKARRVWKGIHKNLSQKNKQLLFHAYLSEERGVEMMIYRFVRRMFDGCQNLETDFGDEDVLALFQLSQKVNKEALRILQFVRFQRTKDDIYFCGIEPKYDVIPLVADHCQNRFADQQWLIYDLRRNYGIFYDKNKVEEVVISKKEFDTYNGQVKQALLNEEEDSYQKLWKNYFKHINIEERRNLKLQRQFMPCRFWKYLPEKQQG